MHPLYSVITTVPLDDSDARTKLENLADNTTPYLWKYGCKAQSQNGEDGIIYHLLQAIGTTPHRTVVELCAGNGIECNSANLILNHKFNAYLFDGNPQEINDGVQFYTQFLDKDPSLTDRVRFAHVWVTKETIVNVMNQMKIPNEMDLLITDLDGNDYWILKSIMDTKQYSPRIICVEYQDIIGPERALTIPYDPQFDHKKYDCFGGPNYCGASLQAFIKLLRDSYAFVGCEGLGFNGFFVRRDLMENLQEMTDISPCFELEKVRFGMANRWPRTAHMEWVEV